MINVVNDVRLITKVCTLYYIDNMNQKAIAELLGLSRPTISRMIANGRKLGIVEITINKKFASSYATLEKELENRLNLKEAIIVADAMGLKEQEALYAKACAELFERLVRPESIIGLSMGTALYRTEKILNPIDLENAVFVPLIGGSPGIETKYQATSLAEKFARRYKAHCLKLYAPARVKDESVREIFLNESSVRKTLTEARQMDIALIELRSFDRRDPVFGPELFSQKDLKELTERKAVGEICYQFFDVHGSNTRFKKLNTTIGINITSLRRVNRSIGIADKWVDYKTILGAIRGQYINTLILSENLALQVLENA